jgi:glycerate kinase
LITTTAGTGDLIRYALDRKVEHIIMGVGGSATNDGGMGMAESLGVVFHDSSGLIIQGNGQNMRRINSFDASSVHPGLANVKFTIFCDVDNPLHGPNGAAYIFSPQKGADEKVVEQLDQGLKHYQQVLENTTGTKVDFPGAGAGGGLPASLKAFANITIRRGMDFISEFTKLEEKVIKADLIITGEGKVDGQTLSGKVVKGIADLSKKHKKSLIVIAGKNELSPREIQLLGAEKVVTLVRENIGEEQAISQAQFLIKTRVKEEIIPLFL